MSAEIQSVEQGGGEKRQGFPRIRSVLRTGSFSLVGAGLGLGASETVFRSTYVERRSLVELTIWVRENDLPFPSSGDTTALVTAGLAGLGIVANNMVDRAWRRHSAVISEIIAEQQSVNVTDMAQGFAPGTAEELPFGADHLADVIRLPLRVE